MGLFDKLFGKGKSEGKAVSNVAEAGKIAHEAADASGEEHPGSGSVAEMMVSLANMAVAKGDYAQAIKTYKNVLKNESNEDAQYNLGVLYAQGKGVERDFMEAAYWFHQAELSGDEQAGKLCTKCAMDFVHQDLGEKLPENLYADTLRFVKYVYRDVENADRKVCWTLKGLADLHNSRDEHAVAAKLLRAAAEFGNDGYAQNGLAVLYNLGAGLEKNDLAALYWFDKAVDNGAADVARVDRDGILNAYRSKLEPSEFHELMAMLAGWCSVGSDCVPKDAGKVSYWRRIAESGVGR